MEEDFGCSNTHFIFYIYIPLRIIRISLADIGPLLLQEIDTSYFFSVKKKAGISWRELGVGQFQGSLILFELRQECKRGVSFV